jgi:hypothetical protein
VERMDGHVGSGHACEQAIDQPTSHRENASRASRKCLHENDQLPGKFVMEPAGIEPATSCLQRARVRVELPAGFRFPPQLR